MEQLPKFNRKWGPKSLIDNILIERPGLSSNLFFVEYTVTSFIEIWAVPTSYSMTEEVKCIVGHPSMQQNMVQRLYLHYVYEGGLAST